jgi:O-antigen ligase
MDHRYTAVSHPYPWPEISTRRRRSSVHVDRHNIGFALLLLLLFIAPELPLRVTGLSTGRQDIPLGFVGLSIWLLLSAPYFGLKAFYKSKPIALFVFFGYYIVFPSIISFNLLSAAYSLHYFYFVFGCSVLVPAYLAFLSRQGRLGEAYSIFALVGAAYVAGILVSIWTGPFYSYAVASAMRHFHGTDVARAVGFAPSVNAAGGVAAVMAAFFLFIYGRQTRVGYSLALVSLLAMVATLSRSAILSFIAAVTGLGLVCMLRLATRGARAVRTTKIVAYLAIPLMLAAFVAASYLVLDASARRAAGDWVYNGLGLSSSIATTSADVRLSLWQQGLAAWAEKPAWQQMLGSGFQTSAKLNESGTYKTAHNAYIQMLNDFGLVGLLLLVSLLAMVIARLTVSIMIRGSDGINMFCFTALMTMTIHNMTEIFFYHPSSVMILVFIMASMYLRTAWRAPADRAAYPPPRPAPDEREAVAMPPGYRTARGDRWSPTRG